MSIEIYKRAGIESFKYFLAKSLPAFFSFVGLIVYSKMFSPQDYGAYALVQTYLYFLLIFPSVIIGNSALRFFFPFKEKNELDKYYSAIFLLYITFTIIAVLILPFFILSKRLSFFLVKLYVLSSVEVIIFGIFTVSLAILLAAFRSKEYLLYSIMFSGIKIPVVVAMVYWLKMGVESIIYGSIVVLLGLFPFLISSLPKPIKIKFGRDIYPFARELVAYGAPLGILGLSNWALQYANRYIINLSCSSREVAYYTVVFHFSQTTILTILSGLLLQTSPTVIEIFEKKGARKAGNYITTMSWWSIVIGIILVVFFFSMSKEILETFTRKDYVVASKLILPLSVSALFAHLSYIYNKALELEKKTSFTALYYGISAIFSVSLCFLLVPLFNIMGAAIANLLSFFLVFLLIYRKGKKFLQYRFPFPSLFWGSALSCIVIIVGLFVKNLFSSGFIRLFLSGTVSSVFLFPLVLKFKQKIFAVELMKNE